MELVLLGAVVSIGKSPQALRWFFLLADLFVLLFAYRALSDHPQRRRWWMILYALTPGPLYFFTLTPSDKPLILAGLLVVLWAVKSSGRKWADWLAVLFTGLLAAFKWFGLLIAFPVAWVYGRRRVPRVLEVLVGVAIIFGLTHLLWFPEWTIVYRFRQMRFGPPFHSGLAVLLHAIGLPMPQLYTPLMVGSWVLVQYLHLRDRIDFPLAMALSVLAVLIWAPDTTAQMLFLLTLLLLLAVDWEHPLWIGLMLASTSWMALMAAAAIGQVIPGLPLVDRFAILSGPYGGLRLVLWSHLPLALLMIRMLSLAIRWKPRSG
ncbi:MAG TPA: hypothetical protein VNK89_06145 [Thermoflexus sp.]|nr:hypothetical protein [Thermoflexus sp.]